MRSRRDPDWGNNRIILGLYWDYIGTMFGLYWDCIGIMENKMETTI